MSFINEKWSWDALKLFIAVARAGGLSNAVHITQVSAPTLGRQMLNLERSLGTKLFHRNKDGYTLTTAGSELLEFAEDLEAEAGKIDRWQSQAIKMKKVTIAAGHWTSLFLAKHLSKIQPAAGNINIEITTGMSFLDLQRRQANLGLRNQRPNTQGLAGQRLTKVAFAIYGSKAYVGDTPKAKTDLRFVDCNWVALTYSDIKPPSVTWLNNHLKTTPILTCSSPHALITSVKAGAGLCILPCFIGDTSGKLIRCSDTIDALSHDQWLVSHDTDRHERHISQVQKGIARVIRNQKNLFAGL